MFVGAGCGVWIMIDPFSYRQQVDERQVYLEKSQIKVEHDLHLKSKTYNHVDQ